MTMDDIDAIAITYGPGLIGSLLIGMEAAKNVVFCTSETFDSGSSYCRAYLCEQFGS